MIIKRQDFEKSSVITISDEFESPLSFMEIRGNQFSFVLALSIDPTSVLDFIKDPCQDTANSLFFLGDHDQIDGKIHEDKICLNSFSELEEDFMHTNNFNLLKIIYYLGVSLKTAFIPDLDLSFFNEDGKLNTKIASLTKDNFITDNLLMEDPTYSLKSELTGKTFGFSEIDNKTHNYPQLEVEFEVMLDNKLINLVLVTLNTDVMLQSNSIKNKINFNDIMDLWLLKQAAVQMFKLNHKDDINASNLMRNVDSYLNPEIEPYFKL